MKTTECAVTQSLPACVEELAVRSGLRVTFLTGLLLAMAAAVPAVTANESNEILANIRLAATTFALESVDDRRLHNVVADAAELDSRLRLRQCSAALEAFATSKTGNSTRMTVGVRCSAPQPWTLYVPVNITAQTDVVYTRRALARGDALTAADLEIRRVALGQLPNGYLSSTEQLQSKQLARPLQSGAVVTLNALTARDLVRQGQEVVIVAERSGVSVRMAGKALKNGSSGELIPVQNSNSGRTIEATVLSDGTVRVNL